MSMGPYPVPAQSADSLEKVDMMAPSNILIAPDGSAGEPVLDAGPVEGHWPA